MKSNSEAESTLIYLDWNVMIDLYNGDLNELSRIIDHYKFEVPYTDFHIIEAFENNKYQISHSDSDRKKKYNQINTVTDNLYLKYEKNQFFIKTNFSPSKAYKVSARTEEAIWSGVRKGINTQIFEQEWQKKLSDMLIPRILNNKSPKEAFKYINRQLKTEQIQSYFSSQNISAKSFSDLIEVTFNYMPFNVPDKSKLYFTTSYILLDVLGYYSEKRIKEKYLSLLADIEHAFHAVATSALITGDVKMKHKTTAIYEYFGITIPVYTPNEFTATIIDVENNMPTER